MPRKSVRKEFLQVLEDTAFAVARLRHENIVAYADMDNSSSSPSNSSMDTSSGSMSPMLISPPSPVSPCWPEDWSDSSFGTDSSFETASSVERADERYVCFLGAIEALHDEVTKARILERPSEPPMRASQLHLLAHFADHRPHLFRKKLRVDPVIFDDILDQISDHPIFQYQSNNKQLPIAIQLAIFLN
ncbi:hypothetical protein BU15DRAFT_80010 [Melanogaster broomeanus]|nr:hypothetical protein BU15DRAFT_80010 [Melanogaster broomeanus]